MAFSFSTLFSVAWQLFAAAPLNDSYSQIGPKAATLQAEGNMRSRPRRRWEHTNFRGRVKGELDKRVIRPLQQRLALAGAAGEVHRHAIGLDLGGMPRKRPPALD